MQRDTAGTAWVGGDGRPPISAGEAETIVGEGETNLRHLEELLAEGNALKACEEAVRRSMWAHALILAAQISREAYQKVLSEFALASLSEGTPLRSLYLLYAVRCIPCVCVVPSSFRLLKSISLGPSIRSVSTTGRGQPGTP